jgi:hypothetical protein
MMVLSFSVRDHIVKENVSPDITIRPWMPRFCREPATGRGGRKNRRARPAFPVDAVQHRP